MRRIGHKPHSTTADGQLSRRHATGGVTLARQQQSHHRSLRTTVSAQQFLVMNKLSVGADAVDGSSTAFMPNLRLGMWSPITFTHAAVFRLTHATKLMRAGNAFEPSAVWDSCSTPQAPRNHWPISALSANPF